MDFINEKRKELGTLPSQRAKTYDIVNGVEGISVQLIDHNINPYKAMYVMGTSCWGDKINKWEDVSPESRFQVVKAVLEGQALPLSLEAPAFTFWVDGLSRAAFDQLARTRIGPAFSARGMRDNDWRDKAIRIPSEIVGTKSYAKVVKLCEQIKDVYSEMVDDGISWQGARCILPMYITYGYSVTIDYLSLRGACANRMKFCEMEDTVATAWLMAKRTFEAFPLLGSYLRPGCDAKGVCDYHKSYTMSEFFGCLFKECGRNKCDSDGYSQFDRPATNLMDLIKAGIPIIKPSEWPKYETIEDLHPTDRWYFVGNIV